MLCLVGVRQVISKIIGLARTLIFAGFESLRCPKSFSKVPRWPTKKINIKSVSSILHLGRIFGPNRFGHVIGVNELFYGAVRFPLFQGISSKTFISTISRTGSPVTKTIVRFGENPRFSPSRGRSSTGEDSIWESSWGRV